MEMIKVRLKMLGQCVLQINEKTVDMWYGGMKITWQLFCALIAHQDIFLSNDELVSILWGTPITASKRNLLKNTVLRLRKELSEYVGGTEPVVEYDTGRYTFSANVSVEADFARFLDVYHSLYNAKNVAGEARGEHYKQLMALYPGHFYCKTKSYNNWMEKYSLNLQSIFMECTSEECLRLWENKEYDEILAICRDAEQKRILYDELLLFRFRALHAKNMYAAISTQFEKASIDFHNRSETDTVVFKEITEIARQAAATRHSNIQKETDILGKGWVMI